MKKFLKSNRNVKVRFIFFGLMEQQLIEKQKAITQQSKAYFFSNTYFSLEPQDVKEIR